MSLRWTYTVLINYFGNWAIVIISLSGCTKKLILPHKEDNWGRLRACSCPLGIDHLVSVTFSEMLDCLGCKGKDWFNSNIQLWADSLLKSFACFVKANDLSSLVITCEGQAVASGKVNVIWSAHFLHLGKKGFLWGRFCGWFLLVAEAITFGMKFDFLISLLLLT